MFTLLLVAALVASASALTNYCPISGTSCTATGSCPSGTVCLYRDSANRVCCPTARAQCSDLRNAQTGALECPAKAAYCNNSLYRNVMLTQCPVTCGFCGLCVDQINPATGVSECPALAAQGYCTRPGYVDLMAQQCPLSCGKCPGK